MNAEFAGDFLPLAKSGGRRLECCVSKIRGEIGLSATSIAPSPRKTPSKFFPGWIMIGFSAGAQFLSAPGQSYSVAAFKKPMQDSLGISETNLSFAYGMATIVSGLVLPWTGRLIDRFGARVVLPIVAALLSLACVFMSMVDSVPSLYVGFTLIRCLGQGAMWLVGTWIVGEWFLRKRGIATALSGLGSSLSVMLFPVMNLYLIERYGWQSTWAVLGLIVSATIILPAICFLRDRPEDLGLHPDGIDPDNDPEDNNPDSDSDDKAALLRSPIANLPTEETWSLREVLANGTFWKLLSVGVCTGCIGTGLVFHQETILSAHGISKDLAMWLIAYQAAVGTVAALWAGRLTDRIPAERLLAAAMFMLSVSVAIVYFMPHWSFVFVFATLNGLHGAIIRTAGTVVWVNYYGRGNQGVIRGAAMSAMILAAALGPIPLAMANDRLGTYAPALVAFAVIPLVSMMMVFTSRQPRRST